MPLHPPRRKHRLPGHDYSAPCAYFVTILVGPDGPSLGRVIDGAVRLSKMGEVVGDAWRWLAIRYSYVELDEFCVMPDHFHGILSFVDRTTTSVRDRETGGTINRWAV